MKQNQLYRNTAAKLICGGLMCALGSSQTYAMQGGGEDSSTPTHAHHHEDSSVDGLTMALPERAVAKAAADNPKLSTRDTQVLTELGQLETKMNKVVVHDIKALYDRLLAGDIQGARIFLLGDLTKLLWDEYRQIARITKMMKSPLPFDYPNTDF